MSFAHSSLDKHVLLQFKNGLREQQRELQQIIDHAEAEIRELSDPAARDIADAAAEHSLENSVIAQFSQNRSRLRLVELALDRIRIGSFGDCIDCGAAIGLKRLQAVPWAGHCINAKKNASRTVLLARQAPPSQFLRQSVARPNHDSRESELNDSPANSDDNRLRPIIRAEFLHDVLKVCFDRDSHTGGTDAPPAASLGNPGTGRCRGVSRFASARCVGHLARTGSFHIRLRENGAQEPISDFAST